MDKNDEVPVSRFDLVFTVEMALMKASGLLPRKRVPGQHERFRSAAEAIVKHMERCGMRCVRKEPRQGHFDPFARREPEDFGGAG
ncbi:MAG: hypothetical protein OYH76_01690 [Defluviicoccus sp.]|nr:hypothetical protein [Defluviicoccus sp.]MDE0274577.1 hypothetical protein [Defluviicoccus sp.]